MATYYVDATGGSDGAAGTSEGAAWQTISKVNAATFSAADSILFKRGEVWRETLIPPDSGSSGSPIAIGAYGSGALPIISGMDLKTGFTEASVADVLESEEIAGTTYTANIGRDTSNFWQGFEYTPDENHTVPKIEVKLEKVGTPTGTVTVEVWDDDSSSPGTIITNGTSATVDVSTVPGTGDWVTFTWTTPPSLTSGSTYYFIIKHGFSLSTSHYIRANRGTVFTKHWRWRIQSGGTEESYEGTTDGLDSRVYKAGVAGSLWEAAVTTEPHVVFMDGTYGVRRSTTNTLAAEFEWHWAANVLTVYAATDPDSRYSEVEISARNYNLDVNAVSWLAVSDLRLEGCQKYGIYLRGDESGNHTFDGVEIHGSAQFGIVTAAADWIRTVALTDCASTYCGSTGFKVNLRTDGWTLTRCTSDHDACIDFEYDDGDGEQQWGAGIKLDAANNTDFCINHVIDDCTVTNAGKKRDGVDVVTTGDQKGFGIWLDWLRCSVAGNGTEVKNSFAHSNLLSGFFCEKTNHSVWSNLYSVLNGEYGFRMDADDDDIVDDNTVSHVTLHGNDVNLFMAGGWAQDGTHFVDNTFRNIICSDAVTYEVVGKWGAENDGTRGSGNTYEYILIATEGTSFIEWRNSGASQIFYDTVAAWETAETGVANNDVGDPLFANEGGTTRAAYKLTAGSPALAAGVDVGLLTDAFGNPWLVPPDIGAHSYSGEHSGTRTPSGIAGNHGINLAVRIGL